MQMMGRGMPMDVNEYVIRPLLTNASVIGLFLIPMITMRLYAEEKRSGTIELLMTSPVRDIEIVLGKWLAALVLYASILGVSGINIAVLFAFGQPDWKPILVGYLGLLLQGGCLLAIGTFISTTDENQIIAGGATFAVCLMLWVLDWVSSYEQSALGQGDLVSFGGDALRAVLERRDRYQRHYFLSFDDFLRALPDRAVGGIPAVEGVNEFGMDESEANPVRRLLIHLSAW